MASIDNFEFAHRHRTEVAWMSQNTNTLPMHPAVLEAIRACVDTREFNLYAFKLGVFGLAESILKDLAVDGLDVLLTNGGIEGEYIAARALLRPGDEVVSTDPSFMPIHEQVAMAGARTVDVDIYREPWALTPERVSEAITPATKMLLLIDPNNPLGSGYTRAQVRGLAEIARDHGLWLLDDITYRDFNPEHVLAHEFYPERTLIAYSFSKAAGLAGMRIGAVLGPPDAIRGLRRFDTNVLGVNVIAQRAALAALETKEEWLPELRRTCDANQRTIRQAVARVRGAHIPVYPSKANMLVVDLTATGVNPEDVETKLLKDHLVHTRAGSYLSRKSGGRFLRVSFTVPDADCEKFATAFPSVLDELRPS